MNLLANISFVITPVASTVVRISRSEKKGYKRTEYSSYLKEGRKSLNRTVCYIRMYIIDDVNSK